MTPRSKSNLSRILVIVPAVLLIAAAASLALTSWEGAPFETSSEILWPFFVWSVIVLCVVFLGCGIAAKRLSNYANTPSWVSTAAVIEMIVGALLVPAAAAFTLSYYF